MPFAQGVDRRVGDLREILAEELADQARLVRNDGARRVVASLERFNRIHKAKWFVLLRIICAVGAGSGIDGKAFHGSSGS